MFGHHRLCTICKIFHITIQIISVDIAFVVARGRLELKIGISDIITNPAHHSFDNGKMIFHIHEVHNQLLNLQLIMLYTSRNQNSQLKIIYLLSQCSI